MSEKPEWLPELFPVSPWSINTFDLLYDIFKVDFIEKQAFYLKHKVWFFPEKENGKELIFWHLTTREDKQANERLPDLRRSERLPWARPMLDNTNNNEVLHWDYIESDGTIKTYIWLQNYDYLIILKKYKNNERRLITAYWLEYRNTKEKLQKKYEQRIVCPK